MVMVVVVVVMAMAVATVVVMAVREAWSLRAEDSTTDKSEHACAVACAVGGRWAGDGD